MIRYLFILFALIAPLTAAIAQTNEPRREYAACMALAKSDPGAGFERAKLWVRTGGDAAVHCLGVSLLGLKKYVKAANLLAALAREITASDTLKAELRAQAAQGWLLADKPKAAAEILMRAIELAPDNVELLVDRSQAWAAQKKYFAAVEDLNLALTKNPGHVDALVFRGSARRRLKKHQLAVIDLDRALELAPEHAEALLERGNLRHLLKDAAGARQDWNKVITVAAGSKAAKAAQSNINQMQDIKN